MREHDGLSAFDGNWVLEAPNPADGRDPAQYEARLRNITCQDMTPALFSFENIGFFDDG